jgi:CheY-like chemotaxis protein
VVDDDDDVRELLCRMLEQGGHAAIPANGGEQALREVTAAAPDLVITDVVMPGMDGFQVLRRVRSLAPRTGVLVISGCGRLDEEYSLETASRLGASAVLRKPFTRAEMLDAVSRALPRPSAQRARQER